MDTHILQFKNEISTNKYSVFPFLFTACLCRKLYSLLDRFRRDPGGSASPPRFTCFRCT